MPSFLLNGTGGYIVTSDGSRIIIADEEGFDHQYGQPASPIWQGRYAPERWTGALSSSWRASPASPIWEGQPE